MRINFRRQQKAPSVPQSSVEIHGELVLLSSSKKKWKSFYGKLDRHQRILCLYDAEKRKSERFDLSKCDYFPLHHTVYDRPYCIGLLPCGASPSDRDDVVLSVDYPGSPGAGSETNGAGRGTASSAGDVDLGTYAGRSDLAQDGGQAEPGLDVIHSRWVAALRRHCRNTHEDLARRQTQMRCYRALDVKIANAKTVPATQLKSRRDDLPLYVVRLDGIEVARAFPGNSTVNVTFDDFPRGFSKLEVLTREENKRKRSVAVDIELVQPHQPAQLACQPPRDTLALSTLISRPSSVEEPGSSLVDLPRSAICEVRERCSPHVTISYRELRVLPFQYYESFRQALLSCIDSGLVSLCSYVWKSLSQDSSKLSFVSSLLLVTTELKCHLRLILNLLKTDVNTEKPSDSYRANTLAAQLLDVYNNLIFSDWRNHCFQRVREEALLQSISSVTITSSCCTTTNNNNNNNSSNGSNGNAPEHSLEYAARPAEGLACCYPSLGHLQLAGGPVVRSKEGSEAHAHLVSIAVEELIKNVANFPLQLRWIYSQLQAVHADQYKNVVLCNLIFLRGLLPSLTHPTSGTVVQATRTGPSRQSSNPSAGVASQSGSAAVCSPENNNNSSSATVSVDSCSVSREVEGVGAFANSALVLVSKTLLALVSPNVNPKLSNEQSWLNWRGRLMQEFRDRITTDLTSEEKMELESLQQSEACAASRKPLSREIAQLASYFLEVLHAKPAPFDSSATCQQQTDSSQVMYSALRDLNWATHQLLTGTGSLAPCVQ